MIRKDINVDTVTIAAPKIVDDVLAGRRLRWIEQFADTPAGQMGGQDGAAEVSGVRRN